MFEQIRETDKPNRGLLWKVIPIAVVVFGIIIGGFVYFGFKKPSQPGPLTGVLRAGDPNFEWYKKYVSIDHKSQKIQLGTNYTGDRIVMFAGTINNGGEKTLDVVEVKVVLFNYDKAVWETVKTPVRPDSRVPLIAPLGRQSFAFYVEALPAAWNAGQAEMWINGFRFAQ